MMSKEFHKAMDKYWTEDYGDSILTRNSFYWS